MERGTNEIVAVVSGYLVEVGYVLMIFLTICLEFNVMARSA